MTSNNIKIDSDSLRVEEQAAIDRFESAFGDWKIAFRKLRKKLDSFSAIEVDDETIKNFDHAENELKSAKEEMSRIVSEIRSGKRN